VRVRDMRTRYTLCATSLWGPDVLTTVSLWGIVRVPHTPYGVFVLCGEQYSTFCVFRAHIPPPYGVPLKMPFLEFSDLMGFNEILLLCRVHIFYPTKYQYPIRGMWYAYNTPQECWYECARAYALSTRGANTLHIHTFIQ
jgi:hypothetical protein